MVQANPSFLSPPGHYDYGLFIILLIGSIGGNTSHYKEHLKRTGILSNKAVLVENDVPTNESVIEAIGKVERRILAEWEDNKRKTLIHVYVRGQVKLTKTKSRQDFVNLILEDNKTYPFENKIRTLCSVPNYLVWCLFDCNRKEINDGVNLGISSKE